MHEPQTRKGRTVFLVLLMELDTTLEEHSSFVSDSLFISADFCHFSCSPPRLNMQGEKEEMSEGKEIVVGPWGGNGGNNWDDGSFQGVREIKLVYGRCIDSIRVVYDRNGRPVPAEKRGGGGGSKTAEMKLQFPEEYLTGFSGHYAPVVHGGSPVIRSLTFRSNRRTFGAFGSEEGTPFSFPMEGGQIVGFKGKCGWYVDAIGFHIAAVRPTKGVQKVQPGFFKRLTSSVTFAPLREGDETRARATKLPA